MSGSVLHPAAFRDLNEIWEFIAADNLDEAARILDELHEAMKKLVDFPEMGFCRDELTSKPLRFFPVRDFLIAYAPDEIPLLVLAVLHTSRNPRALAAVLRQRK
ncbi:MAG TPA: type II toxin-antitoxin system RelE/ParE family toxin [Candidatus Acidoferrum sp.]|nr:type II toxin-antitoxin system RelE/ParE family toxin [Candidatus Acidoferrum sp.]